MTAGPVSKAMAESSEAAPERSELKTYCKHLEIDEGFVLAAIDEWLAHGSGRRNGWRIRKEYGSAADLAAEIAREVRGRCLSLAPISTRERRDPSSGKVRSISVECVKQQVCDYLAVRALAPLISAKVGHWQVGGVPGRGPIAGKRAIERRVGPGVLFVHGDCVKAYQSIRTDAVAEYVGRRVRSPDVMYLVRTLLATMGGGLILGSYLSLQLCLLVTSCAYHAVEGLAYTRRGKRVPCASFQVWYADDVYMLGTSMKGLQRAMRAAAAALRPFGVSLHRWKVCRADCEPIRFTSYRITDRGTTLRKRLYVHVRRAFRRFARRGCAALARRVCSYWGYLSHTDSRRARARNGFDSIFSAARTVCAA